MLLRLVRVSPSFIPIFTKRFENDTNTLEHPPSAPKTGWDRVKAMYSTDEYGERSAELHSVVQSSLCGAFIGACMGGFVSSRQAYLYFIENNQATIFKTTMQAKKRLQDYVTLKFAKGAYTWGWKLGIFTGIFSLLATTVSVYNDETRLTDFIGAGTITGGMCRVHLGLAATVVGAGLGAVLSTISGLAILGILKVSGFSMNDVRKALYSVKEARHDQFNQALEKSSTIKNDNLTQHHDSLVKEKGEEKIAEIQ
ncbi:hypothetical protein K1T71_004597 [Dendrolimus kikuchii]|uniref:Uncharacterized protein n=1 Tax=Dendrolimus kikuchii TaxID=765133 RepID=A0ACC1D852_9NEOP|nr:hypothetical protein K1T71_004597 [Dendrolimus kikuchii]